MKFHIAHIVPDPRQHGLYGYQELIDTIRWGLTSLGHEVTTQVNVFAADSTNIVLGFQVLQESALDALPSNTIVYNLEQIAGLRIYDLKPVYYAAARRLRIWEYSERNMEKWRKLQPVYPIVHVPLGWAPVLARIPTQEHKDIDVLFYGLPGKTRLSIFSELCTKGMTSVFACGLYGMGRDGLIARAKLVLNMNLYSASRIFEIVRVSYLLANTKAVVSDWYPEMFVESDIRDAVAFASPDRVTATCLELLHNEPARLQLERRGEEIMKRREIRTILASALSASGLTDD